MGLSGPSHQHSTSHRTDLRRIHDWKPFDWHMIYSFIMPVPILFSFYWLMLTWKFVRQKQASLWWYWFLPPQLFPFLWWSSPVWRYDSQLALSSYFSPFPLPFFILRSLTVQHPLDIRILKKRTNDFILEFCPFNLPLSNLSSNFLIPNFLVLVKNTPLAQADFPASRTMIGAFGVAFFWENCTIAKAQTISLLGGNQSFWSWLSLASYKLAQSALILGFYILLLRAQHVIFNNTMALDPLLKSADKTSDVTALFN